MRVQVDSAKKKIKTIDETRKLTKWELHAFSDSIINFEFETRDVRHSF